MDEDEATPPEGVRAAVCDAVDATTPDALDAICKAHAERDDRFALFRHLTHAFMRHDSAWALSGSVHGLNVVSPILALILETSVSMARDREISGNGTLGGPLGGMFAAAFLSKDTDMMMAYMVAQREAEGDNPAAARLGGFMECLYEQFLTRVMVEAFPREGEPTWVLGWCTSARIRDAMRFDISHISWFISYGFVSEANVQSLFDAHVEDRSYSSLTSVLLQEETLDVSCDSNRALLALINNDDIDNARALVVHGRFRLGTRSQFGAILRAALAHPAASALIADLRSL